MERRGLYFVVFDGNNRRYFEIFDENFVGNLNLNFFKNHVFSNGNFPLVTFLMKFSIDNSVIFIFSTKIDR